MIHNILIRSKCSVNLLNYTSKKVAFNNFKNPSRKFQNGLLRKAKSKSMSTIAIESQAKTILKIPNAEKARKFVGCWLLGCSGAVAGAVVIGGVTRLTKSGLSMTDWNLITGMKPPRSQEEWLDEFNRYKNYPEYKIMRSDMTLNEFKFIFYMEWFHRMYGRFVGLTFYIPAIYFWRKGYLSKEMKPRTILFGTLILSQGLLGWYMVKSGLHELTMSNSDKPRVSQYRLAAHLGLAFTVYSGLLYNALKHLLNENPLAYTKQLGRMKTFAHSSMALTFITALSGAFVAGLDAGLVYNSFPMFADRWIPSDIAALNPWWKNMFENPTTTQFNHRVLALTTFSAIIATYMLASPIALPWRAKMAANAMLGMSFVQVGLGISTLLLYVPTHLAASHQFGSLTLLSFLIWFNFELRSAKIPK